MIELGFALPEEGGDALPAALKVLPGRPDGAPLDVRGTGVRVRLQDVTEVDHRGHPRTSSLHILLKVLSKHRKALNMC